jgi:hypothetical protein
MMPGTGRVWTKRVLLALLVAVVIVAAVPGVRESALRGMGSALVVDEPLEPADAIVVTLDSEGAGALEAADLVKAGIASRVAIFADPPSPEFEEFKRRGLPYEDRTAVQARQLQWLGVEDVVRIPAMVWGTDDVARALPAWCGANGFRVVVLVTDAGHARRTRRAVDRAISAQAVRVIVRPSRYSAFEANGWWQTRSGTRMGIIESQKLLLDLLAHPFN